MTDEILNTVLQNKNDLIEGTFCYELFEHAIFDVKKCEKFVMNVNELKSHPKFSSDVKPLISWVLSCVAQCFASHMDIDDLFFIKNHSTEIENQWQIYASQLNEL